MTDGIKVGIKEGECKGKLPVNLLGASGEVWSPGFCKFPGAPCLLKCYLVPNLLDS